MLKRTMALLAPAAVIAAISMVPISASADTVTQCPKGTTNKAYCKKVKECVVPKLRGKHLDAAEKALKAHDCKVGTINKEETDKKGTDGCPKGKDCKLEHNYEKGVVVRSNPKAGAVRPNGTKVNLLVET